MGRWTPPPILLARRSSTDRVLANPEHGAVGAPAAGAVCAAHCPRAEGLGLRGREGGSQGERHHGSLWWGRPFKVQGPAHASGQRLRRRHGGGALLLAAQPLRVVDLLPLPLLLEDDLWAIAGKSRETSGSLGQSRSTGTCPGSVSPSPSCCLPRLAVATRPSCDGCKTRNV